jgi:hypothetical protein
MVAAAGGAVHRPHQVAERPGAIVGAVPTSAELRRTQPPAPPIRSDAARLASLQVIGRKPGRQSEYGSGSKSSSGEQACGDVGRGVRSGALRRIR